MAIGFDKNARHKALLGKVKSYEDLTDLPESTQDQLAALRKDLPVVAVCYYGGTIGMTKDSRGNLVPTDNAEELLEPLALKGLKDEVQVVWIPVYDRAIDSTNARWVHWVSIGNCIRLLHDIVAGFVVCGGTDTMAHMTAAMSFMFPNIGKPIIGAGSQLPMFVLGDDATGNLYRSIVAAVSDLSGAHLVFGDELMHGLHVHKVQDRRFKAFTTPAQYMLGHFTDELVLYPSAPRRSPIVTGARLKFSPEFREGIKVVEISPATPSEELLHEVSSPTCSVLLLITFGAGNVRNEGILERSIEASHISCLRTMHGEGFPVVLGSPMIDGVVDSPYKSGALAVSTEEYGGNAISAGDTTGPCLQVKCMVALAHSWREERAASDLEEFRKLMETNLVGELTV